MYFYTVIEAVIAVIAGIKKNLYMVIRINDKARGRKNLPFAFCVTPL